ncbi:MAG TPA: hypothetical protein VG826_15330 [Pirellulales bacterium]|nr:hypothetical protein [Pirellulales bacterium]
MRPTAVIGTGTDGIGQSQSAITLTAIAAPRRPSTSAAARPRETSTAGGTTVPTVAATSLLRVVPPLDRQTGDRRAMTERKTAGLRGDGIGAPLRRRHALMTGDPTMATIGHLLRVASRTTTN